MSESMSKQMAQVTMEKQIIPELEGLYKAQGGEAARFQPEFIVLGDGHGREGKVTKITIKNVPVAAQPALERALDRAQLEYDPKRSMGTSKAYEIVPTDAKPIDMLTLLALQMAIQRESTSRSLREAISVVFAEHTELKNPEKQQQALFNTIDALGNYLLTNGALKKPQYDKLVRDAGQVLGGGKQRG